MQDVPGPAGAGQQRRPDHRGGVGAARSNHGGQQHVGDPAGAAAGPPRAQGQRGVAVVARSGCGRDPTGAAGGCIAGRGVRRRPGRSRPERGRRSRSSAARWGHGARAGLPAPPVAGVSWCGTRSGPSAGRAGRIDTGRARHVDDAPRRPRALGAGRSRFVVMVAAPTNPRALGVRRHRQWRESAGRSSSRVAVNTGGRRRVSAPPLRSRSCRLGRAAGRGIRVWLIQRGYPEARPVEGSPGSGLQVGPPGAMHCY